MATQSYDFPTRDVTMIKPDGSMGFALVTDEEGKIPLVTICELQPGGCAELSGFKVDDRMVTINGVNTLHMTDDAIVEIFSSAGPGDELVCVVANVNDVKDAMLKVTKGDEATVGYLLQASVAEEHRNKSVSEILKTVPTDDPLINKVKLAVYDLTVPLTTRPQRPEEVDGQHYHFVTVEEFNRYIAEDKMLEYGDRNGVFYGTLKMDAKMLPKSVEPQQQQQQLQQQQQQQQPSKNNDAEATMGQLLGDVASAAHRNKFVSEFFSATPDNHATLGDLKAKARERVYDLTTPFTTRSRREGEKHGREYFFVDLSEFKKQQRMGMFLEIGERAGTLYGTPKVLQRDINASVSRRSVLTDAITNAPSEPSVEELLALADIGSNNVEGLHRHSASQFLAQVDPTDPKLAEVRKSIKDKIYDLTVPLTTRPKRAGEVDGVNYNFVSREQFENYIHTDRMLEYGEKNGVYYGTMKLTKDQFDSHNAIKRRTTMAEALEQPGAITSSKPYVTLGDEETWSATLV